MQAAVVFTEIWFFSSLIFCHRRQTPDRQKLRHKSSPCIGTGKLKNYTGTPQLVEIINPLPSSMIMRSTYELETSDSIEVNWPFPGHDFQGSTKYMYLWSQTGISPGFHAKGRTTRVLWPRNSAVHKWIIYNISDGVGIIVLVLVLVLYTNSHLDSR